MNLHELELFLLWCAGIGYAFLLLWMIAFAAAHDAMFRLHARWFRLTIESFDAVHYAGMAALKIGIMLLFLVPYIALKVIH